jgi:hypothetical protein
VLPISWRNRDLGVSQLKLKEQGSRYLFTLLTVWFEWLLIRNDHRRASDEVFVPWDERPSAPPIEFDRGEAQP